MTGNIGFVLFNVNTNCCSLRSRAGQTENDTRSVLEQNANSLMRAFAFVNGIDIFEIIKRFDFVITVKLPTPSAAIARMLSMISLAILLSTAS